MWGFVAASFRALGVFAFGPFKTIDRTDSAALAALFLIAYVVIPTRGLVCSTCGSTRIRSRALRMTGVCRDCGGPSRKGAWHGVFCDWGSSRRQPEVTSPGIPSSVPAIGQTVAIPARGVEQSPDGRPAGPPPVISPPSGRAVGTVPQPRGLLARRPRVTAALIAAGIATVSLVGLRLWSESRGVIPWHGPSDSDADQLIAVEQSRRARVGLPSVIDQDFIDSFASDLVTRGEPAKARRVRDLWAGAAQSVLDAVASTPDTAENAKFAWNTMPADVKAMVAKLGVATQERFQSGLGKLRPLLEDVRTRDGTVNGIRQRLLQSPTAAAGR